MFEAIHTDGKKLLDTDEMASVLAPLGVDKDVFINTYNSFAVVGQVATAKRLTMAYQVNSVPTLIVEGKYRFDARSTGGWSNTLEVADQLIEQQRNSKTALAAQR
jgi:thiol:disulfide interchange protein DsbA